MTCFFGVGDTCFFFPLEKVTPLDAAPRGFLASSWFYFVLNSFFYQLLHFFELFFVPSCIELEENFTEKKQPLERKKSKKRFFSNPGWTPSPCFGDGQFTSHRILQFSNAPISVDPFGALAYASAVGRAGKV